MAGEPSPAAIVARLRALGWTVATAESLSGGLITARLTEVPGASAVVRGGLVVYATDLKATLAGVSRETLRLRGAVCPEVAADLARGARLRCQADWGVGLTGVAGPGPLDGVAPGTVYIGLDGPGLDEPVVREMALTGGRVAIRRAAVDAALRLLDEHLNRG